MNPGCNPQQRIEELEHELLHSVRIGLLRWPIYHLRLLESTNILLCALRAYWTVQKWDLRNAHLEEKGAVVIFFVYRTWDDFSLILDV